MTAASTPADEEVEAIGRIVDDLLTRDVVDKNGGPRRLTLGDIPIVAPFNMQVRKLKARLGVGARVGSVDLFQGQEAAVVIVSRRALRSRRRRAAPSSC